MADEITLTGTFEDIADAIREKGISGTMKATDMPGKIRQIAQLDPEDYYTKSETSSAEEISAGFDQLSDYYEKTETSSAAEISAADEGVRSYASDAINYISSEVSADVDSTNVKHISACYLTDYVELSTSGTPDPDTLYFCVG